MSYSPAHKMPHEFSLEILEENNNECILILVIYWRKTGLLHTKISNHNIIYYNMIRYDIYLLTAIVLTPGGCSTVHIYTQTIHRTTQNKQFLEQQKILEECGPCPILANYTLAFASQLRKKHGKTSSQGSQTIRIHTPNNKNT